MIVLIVDVQAILKFLWVYQRLKQVSKYLDVLGAKTNSDRREMQIWNRANAKESGGDGCEL